MNEKKLEHESRTELIERLNRAEGVAAEALAIAEIVLQVTGRLGVAVEAIEQRVEYASPVGSYPTTSLGVWSERGAPLPHEIMDTLPSPDNYNTPKGSMVVVALLQTRLHHPITDRVYDEVSPIVIFDGILGLAHRQRTPYVSGGWHGRNPKIYKIDAVGRLWGKANDAIDYDWDLPIGYYQHADLISFDPQRVTWVDVPAPFDVPEGTQDGDVLGYLAYRKPGGWVFGIGTVFAFHDAQYFLLEGLDPAAYGGSSMRLDENDILMGQTQVSWKGALEFSRIEVQFPS